MSERHNEGKKPVKKATPVKKDAVPKKTAKKVVEAVDEAVEVVEANKDAVKKAVHAVAPTVTDAQVEEVLAKAPGFWAKVKSFLGF